MPEDDYEELEAEFQATQTAKQTAQQALYDVLDNFANLTPDQLKAILEEALKPKQDADNTHTPPTTEEAILRGYIDTANGIGTNTKYTLAWFKALVELEAFFSNTTGGTQNVNIRFKGASLDASRQLLTLTDTSHNLPSNIDTCVGLTMSYTAQNISQQQNIQGISVYEQKVIIALGTPIPINTLSDISISIPKGSPSIGYLKKAWLDLEKKYNLQDTYNLLDNLTPNIEFVFGPPGTGKTTHLAKTLIEQFVTAEKMPKVLFLTPTNKAADVIVNKIIEICEFAGANSFQDWATHYGYDIDNELHNNIHTTIVEQGTNPIYTSWLYRFGMTENGNIIKKGLYYPKSLPKAFLGGGVVATVSMRFPYDIMNIQNTSNYFSFKDFDWDLIIFDEASMIKIAEIAYTVQQQTLSNKRIKFMIAGDPFQIPPVVKINETIKEYPGLPKIDQVIKDENIYTFVDLQKFNQEATHHQHPTPQNVQYPLTNLLTQYRSYPAIGELFSQFCYNGALQHSRPYLPVPNYLSTSGKIWKPTTFIKFPLEANKLVYRADRIDRSGYHIHSAILVVEFVKELRNDLIRNKLDKSIGIICPYKTQVELVKKQLEGYNVYVSTVHKFQGDEMDVIIALFNPPSHTILSPTHDFAKNYHLHKKNIINVAISRAKDYLFVLMPDDNNDTTKHLTLFKGSEGIETLAKNNTQINQYTEIIHSNGLENLLWGENEYIYNNTDMLPHEMINIYQPITTTYLVRSDKSNIDLQISKNLPATE